MSNVVIRAEGLSKHYRLGAIGGATLREDLQRWWGHLRRRPDSTTTHGAGDSASSGDHWALQDVSFEVHRGEVLAVIGRNGAGKSTLLKILSRTTAPSSGLAKVRGRIGSLLEVGTGFHPELTGRENIYLNGSILGMKKREIVQKIDEIIDFSGVERFIDTPVKRYSSGMYVRLAFSVAAHLEPEILIVDEVLAVGDADFQKKCLGKMEGVAADGRTVIFVSHNLAAVSKLCSRSILLEQGKLIANASTQEVISQYMRRETSGRHMYFCDERQSDTPYFKNITLIQRGLAAIALRMDEEFAVEFELDNCQGNNVSIGVQIHDASGSCLHHLSDEFAEAQSSPLASRSVRKCEFPPYALAAGRYWLTASVGKRNYQLYERLEYALEFVVEFVGVLADRSSADLWQGVTGPGFAKWTLVGRD